MMPAPHPLESWLIAARALHVGACVLLFGEMLFAVAIARTLPRVRLVVASVAVALLAAIAWLACTAVVASGETALSSLTSSTVAAVLTKTLFGRVWLARVALLALVGALAARQARGPHGMRAEGGAALALSALALAGVALAGHAAAATGARRAAEVGADALHLVAAGAWVGSLPALAAALMRTQVAGRLALVRGWSRMAVAAVVVVLASGVANAAFRLGSIEALVATRYGAVLLAKLVLVAAMLAIAAFNRLRLTPRLDRAAVALARNARLEIAAGIVVVALASALGSIAPPAHVATHRHAPHM